MAQTDYPCRVVPQNNVSSCYKNIKNDYQNTILAGLRNNRLFPQVEVLTADYDGHFISGATGKDYAENAVAIHPATALAVTLCLDCPLRSLSLRSPERVHTILGQLIFLRG